MPEDFYFAYGLNGNTASRLYRYIGGSFERYDVAAQGWQPDPEQCRIFIGEDLEYEEITEEQANQIQIIV
ncbi:hypothetical protein [Paenibacillus sp. NFR01]|uniref:hypothetical protein n=1 Tax=Paenibacillus sp. NFR01 TaxID=1566279 RepID=UPI0008B7BA9C|nr:hypothetical protein [Paenibacillus sp. NFR01]SEU32365.1 hypothetical protein SAMN03159358_0116 [Paenibacillus sp. NFR01]